MRPEKKAYIEKIKRKCSQDMHIDGNCCKSCGGKCCKTSSCGLMPCDIADMTVHGIKSMLDTEKYSITFFFLQKNKMLHVIPVMAAREVGGKRIDNSFIRKPCAILTETGCMLSEEERPTQGLLYIPNEVCCRSLLTGEEIYLEWRPYKDILEAVILEETGKTVKELVMEGYLTDSLAISAKLKNTATLTKPEFAAFRLIQMIERCTIIE